MFAVVGVQCVADAGDDLFPGVRAALRAVQFGEPGGEAEVFPVGGVAHGVDLFVDVEVAAVADAVEDEAFDALGVLQGEPEGDGAAHAGAAEVGGLNAFGVHHVEYGFCHQADAEAFARKFAFAVAGQVGDEDAVALCQRGDLWLPFFARHAAAVQEDDGLAVGVAVGLVVDHRSSFLRR